MTRSKRFSKSIIKSGLLCSLVASLFFSGCGSTDIPPTYKEEDIPYLVKNICKDEYALDVTTYRTNTTLWIYVPLSNIMHKQYGVDEDKVFSDEVLEKLRNILTSIGRVLISADHTPEFYALVASDINIGLDYALVGNVLDVKKTYAGAIPWMESNRRYLVDFRLNPRAIKDRSGIHLEPYDITLPDFLAKLIAQRAEHALRDENTKKFFKIEKLTGEFHDGVFVFQYKVQVLPGGEKLPGVLETLKDTMNYCLKSYEFSGFTGALVTDEDAQRTTELTKQEILAKPIN